MDPSQTTDTILQGGVEVFDVSNGSLHTHMNDVQNSGLGVYIRLQHSSYYQREADIYYVHS